MTGMEFKFRHSSVVPGAQLVYLSAPEGETEAQFWRRKAAERSERNTWLERELREMREDEDAS